MPCLTLWKVGGLTLCPKTCRVTILASSPWLTRSFLSSELQVWPQARLDLLLPAAGSQWFWSGLQPQPLRLHGLPLPEWLEHLRHCPEHLDLE